MLSRKICAKARLSRDPRFDGRFFTAVKTTGIYCRSVCPATPPKEKNVTYYETAMEAAVAGYRPCLRCRPDSAPGSPAWKGVNTTLERALRLIDQGTLQGQSTLCLAEKLGISDRYLRQLFHKHLGVSPKAYALYQQCLFAKQLLHDTALPITQVALASGFNSIRRFNDCFISHIKLTPSQIRRSAQPKLGDLQLQLCYRPPYDWRAMRDYLAGRMIAGMEWCDEHSYGRTFEWGGVTGAFTLTHRPKSHDFQVDITLDKLSYLKSVVNNIRRIFDLDVDISAVDRDLRHCAGKAGFKKGLRLPGAWTPFEAGVRAILGQQISVKAAIKLLTTLTQELGRSQGDGLLLFPSPEAIFASDLAFIKMPGARKQTLREFAYHCTHQGGADDPEGWLGIKGVGRWTVDYAKMRGLSDPDIYLGGDLGIKKSVERLGVQVKPELVSPWRSYLTLQLWNLT